MSSSFLSSILKMYVGDSLSSEEIESGSDACDDSIEIEVDLEVENGLPVVLNDDALDDEAYRPTPVELDDEVVGSSLNKQEHHVIDEGEFKLEQCFKDTNDFKDVVMDYSVKRHRAVKFSRSNTNRVQAKCCDNDCPWRIWCSIEKKFHKFQIKSIEERHTCAVSSNSPLCDSRWLAKKFIEKFRSNNSYKAGDLKNDCLNTFGVTVSLAQCYRARNLALRKIQGNQAEHFAKIRRYENELIISNRGSTVLVQTDYVDPEKPSFQRMYVCFNALRQGWLESCRPIMGLDGAFLKWFVKGEILSTIGRDANNQMYPIAWAVVEVKNTNSWTWFIKLLAADLGFTNGDGLTLVTDGQKGLLRAISDLLPNAKHRICARHIYANWRKMFKQPELKPKFWAVAKSYTQAEMTTALSQIRQISIDAANDLQRNNMESWCLAFFTEESCSDVVHNNMPEAFNSSIRRARRKPIIDMLEDIRIATMQRMANRINLIARWDGRITPKAQKEIDTRIQASLFSHIIPNGRMKWEVHRGDGICVVDMERRTCACRLWGLSGIPCSHAVVDILSVKHDVVDYISPYYTRVFWEKAYMDVLNPLNGEHMWPESNQPDILPPISRRMPGRHKRNRRKDPTESPSKKRKVTRHGRIIQCDHCLQPGHNKLGCEKRVSGDPLIPSPQRIQHKTGRPSTSSQVSSSGTNTVRRKRSANTAPSHWNLPSSHDRAYTNWDFLNEPDNHLTL